MTPDTGHVHRRSVVWLLLPVLCLPACSIKRMAVNKLGNAMAGSGTVFASDDDPELVKAAAPFSLKLMESLLEASPRHDPLLVATASGFTQFAYAFVQLEAEELESEDLAAAEAMRARARRLYLRARGYGLRGLEARHAGLAAGLARDPRMALEGARARDVPLLYWTAVSWGAAIALAKDNPDLVADLSIVEALIDRALALDEGFGDGAIHEFLISFEMGRPGGAAGAVERAREHFKRAMELSAGRLAGPLVSLAESVCVREQNRAEFRTLLERALSINPDGLPEARLLNLIMQRRARWLLSRIDDLFVETETETHAR